MKRKRDRKPGQGKILEAWVPAEEAGEPIGCVATSYTFLPAFFEEECLGRFLHLDSNANEDGPVYLVEREEKLSQLVCAAALVDQNHARGVRSLRWDLLPARLPHGILHAKVSLLLWSRLARLIVASANLTEDGYRRNHEVFGILDYFEGSEAPLAALEDVVGLLREAVGYVNPERRPTGAAVERWGTFLDRVSSVAPAWGRRESPRSLSRTRTFAVITGPERPSAFAQLREGWPDGSPPDYAAVVSPFFDPPEAPNRPAAELWALLRQRGEATVRFLLSAEELPGENVLLLHAPESLIEAQPANRSQVETLCSRLLLEDGRPLHAKCLWVLNERVALHMAGSSNFTSAGLGLGGGPNIEVNLAYAAGQESKDSDALFDACLPFDDIDDGLEVRWQPRLDEGEDSACTGLLLLPPAFGEATFGCDDTQHGFIKLTFNGSPPLGWVLFAEDDRDAFLTEAAWAEQGRPLALTVPWQRNRAPSGFGVSWVGSEGWAWWPVNVLNPTVLPPPAELRDLPLEVLVDILTSARPLHRAVQAWLRKRGERSTRADGPPLDPHKRVDTSSFLLQRTRRLSDALRALRLRLERPVFSEPALDWRLRGPVGVEALAKAVAKEARTEQERCFLLTELCLELAWVRPRTAAGSLSEAHVRAALCTIAQEIRTMIPPDVLNTLPALAEYTVAAFEEIGR